MKIAIDPGFCIGCGLYVEAAPDVYELQGEVTFVKVEEVSIDKKNY
jgi:ferredoxin